MTEPGGPQRGTNPARLAVLVVATVLGGMIAAVAVIGSHAIEPKLTEAATAALREAGLDDVRVRFEGREASVSSRVATPADLREAQAVVARVDGVRSVTVVEPAAVAAEGPALAVVADPDGSVTVTGTVGSAAEQARLVDAAEAAFETVGVAVLIEDGVDQAPWATDAATLFAALGPVRDVVFRLDASGATIAGSAPDPAATEADLEAVLDGIPLTSALTAAEPTADERAALEGVSFLFSAEGASLAASADARVAEVAELLTRYPALRIRLVGHIAIVTGTPTEVTELCERRARTVADALVAAGVAADRLEIRSAGADEPVADNGTEQGAAQNRRVSVEIVEAG